MTSFGLFINTGEQLGANHTEVFQFALEQADLAEELGYQDVWVSEHHFIPFGINSNALTLAGFLLGRTRRLRVGTAVCLAPQYHPLQLAEQVAILDQCGQGRLDFGVGRGGYLKEFEAFGVDTARWSDEVEASIAVMCDAWTKDTVRSTTPWFPFEDVRLHPRPRSLPHPPLYVATSTPAGVCAAARRGAPLLHFWASPLEARQKVERAYAAERERLGLTAPVEHVHAMLLCVTDDEAGTRARLEQALLASFQSGEWPHVPQAANRHLGPDGKPVRPLEQAAHVARAALVGSPSALVARLEELRARHGISRFVFNMEAIADREITLTSISRFARDIAPRLRASRP